MTDDELLEEIGMLTATLFHEHPAQTDAIVEGLLSAVGAAFTVASPDSFAQDHNIQMAQDALEDMKTTPENFNQTTEH